tara:strand:+ start:102 stop:569 length:468 start_codon:yes stop_codon:yes gene_type:complete
MNEFAARDPDFEARIRASFGRQSFMQHIGAELTHVMPGRVEIHLPWQEFLGQQHGYFHGGVIGTIADNACGYAAFSLAAAEDSVLTVEYKLNLVAPGKGEALIARGEVIKPGRTLTVCEARIYAVNRGKEKLSAIALETLTLLPDTPDSLERHRD